MPKKIAILEDNAERCAAMRRCLEDRFYQFDIEFFGNATEMREFCDRNLSELIVIDLDHDLELQPGPNGHCVDPGTGKEVVDYLAKQTPVCPIVLHTSNGSAGDEMERMLRGAGWTTQRVVPHDDLEWIPTEWFRAIRRAIVGNPASERMSPR